MLHYHIEILILISWLYMIILLLIIFKVLTVTLHFTHKKKKIIHEENDYLEGLFSINFLCGCRFTGGAELYH